eukprot:5600843-Amphidinium_carterae.1
MQAQQNTKVAEAQLCKPVNMRASAAHTSTHWLLHGSLAKAQNLAFVPGCVLAISSGFGICVGARGCSFASASNLGLGCRR